MRIFIAVLFAPLLFAHGSSNYRQPALKGLDFKRVDFDRLNQEMEFLSNNVFLEEKNKPEENIRSSYFDRRTLAEEALPEEVVDLDQVYFSDEVSTKAASPKKEAASKERGPKR